jgi:hypothetical protein
MATRIRIAAALLLVAAAAAIAAWALRPSPTHAATARIDCGVERWTVKTLGDRPTLIPSRPTTIKYLSTRPAPSPLPWTRLPFERHVYRVTAAVTLVRR